jgi:parallel beta-helix repeat protein
MQRKEDYIIKRLYMSIIVALAFLKLDASVWVVDTTGKEGDSLQTAINLAATDPGIDTVLVKNGTYHLFINDTVGLIIRDSVVLLSESGADKCTLTALSENSIDTAWHVIFCSYWLTLHAAVIKGFTIKNGNARGSFPHNRGGGIYISRASPVIESCKTISNSADYSGGGIYIDNNSSPTLSNNVIEGNSATLGGGISIGYSSPTLSNNTIEGNSAALGGGISIYNNSSPTLSNNIIKDNSADERGGGIYIWYYSSPTLSDNIIESNSADYSGGGIYIYYYSSPTLSYNTIKGNSARWYGGGIYIGDSSSPTLSNNTIEDNSATRGGGIYIWRSSPTLSKNTIKGNSARWYGGGIYILAYSSPTLSNNMIKSNSAADDGGGIYIYYYSSPTLSDNIIEGNSARWYGGGICIYEYSSPTLNNNIIEDNSAWQGGGISIRWYSSPTLSYNTIKGNSARWYGGGIYIGDSSSPTLSNNTIEDNSATRGGGIYIWRSSPTLSKNIISYNTADSCGGAIFVWHNSSLTIKGCVLNANISGRGGAVFDTLYSKVIIDSSFIVDNGNIYDNKSGLAYITADADSGVTFKMSNSNIYFNTYQSDTEIYNLSGVTIDLQGNFWWDTTDAEISAIIYGANEHSNWQKDFIQGVPGEPLQIDLVRAYIDSSYSVVTDSIWQPCTLYLRIFGEDRTENIREVAIAIVKTSIYPEGIAVGLIETDTSSGIYDGKIYVLESTGNDTIRVDDIYQRTKVYPVTDIIEILTNVDETKKWNIVYKKTPIPNIEVSCTSHDFGNVNVGDTVDFELFCRNEGAVMLMIDSTKVNLPFSVVSPVLPCSVGRGDSIKMVVRFVPPDTGDYTDTLKIYSNDPDESVRFVYLEGRGIMPGIKLSDTTHDYGVVEVNDTSSWELWIYNKGNIDLVVDSITLTTPIYTITGLTLPDTIIASDSQSIMIKFTPQDTGKFYDTLNVYSNDPYEPVAKVFLSGRGVIPDIVLQDTLIILDTVVIGDTVDFSFYIKNEGSAILILDSIKVTNSALKVEPTSSPINPNDSLKINGKYMPQSPEQDTGRILIYSNDPNEPVVYVKINSYIGIEELPLPKRFEFKIISPNPLQKYGIIYYALPVRSYVSIKIYDVMGRCVTNVVDKEVTPGFYLVEFKTNLSQGIYFVKMSAGKFNSVRKFVVIK